MNRRWFFGCLAAAALLPQRAVGQLKYTSYTFRIVNEDLYGKTRLLEQQWENDVFVTGLPVAFRRASNRVKSTIILSKGRYRHICRWTESTAFNCRTVKVGEIKSSPGLLWNITDEGLDK